MQIAGLQKVTLVDFPGKIAATVFTRGCNFRCPFCHNPELVLPEQYNPLLDEDGLFEFLEKRKNQLQGICITGGEPTIQKDLPEFIEKLKKLGYSIKLDTNGSNPEMLEELIKSGNLDYIAMDIKSPLRKYEEVTNPSRDRHSGLDPESSPTILSSSGPEGEPLALTPGSSSSCHSREDGNLVANIKKSISLIMNSGIDYEFRTTVVKPLHKVEDFEEIGKLIKGAKRYFIQNYVKSKQINDLATFEEFSDDEIGKVKKITDENIQSVEIR